MLLGTGCVALAAGHALLLALKARALAESLGPSALGDFAATTHVRAGVTRILLALAVGGAVLWLRRAPGARHGWALPAVLATLLAGSGAWLTHAAGRLDSRAWLMALTVSGPDQPPDAARVRPRWS
jgi:hypothetical protein